MEPSSAKFLIAAFGSFGDLHPFNYAGRMLRRALFLAVLLASSALAAETLRLRPGASTTLRLTENPSTGYSWRLDTAASVGLDRVAISDAGHKRSAALPGAPGERLWIIRGVAPGAAKIAFAYQRPWEAAPVEKRRVDVVVAPR
jgi:inhibitor of cysteine peptidase